MTIKMKDVITMRTIRRRQITVLVYGTAAEIQNINQPAAASLQTFFPHPNDNTSLKPVCPPSSPRLWYSPRRLGFCRLYVRGPRHCRSVCQPPFSNLETRLAYETRAWTWSWIALKCVWLDGCVGLSRMKERKNEGLGELLGLAPVSLMIKKNRLTRYGHVERKDDNDWVKRCKITFFFKSHLLHSGSHRLD